MRLSSLHSLRTFVFLLLAVFVTDIVYASGMMASANFQNLAESVITQENDNQQAHHAEQCHDQHQTEQESKSHTNCSDCNHCLACFSIIPQGHLSAISIPSQISPAHIFSQVYLSPTRARPQKPPIV